MVIERKLLFQRKSMQSLFDEKVKGLVEELLHIDESARFVLILRHFVLICCMCSLLGHSKILSVIWFIRCMGIYLFGAWSLPLSL